ncbi:hypothetical protein [Nocardia caishijiensis]|uniref:Immunity protein 53 of polymorphic toxin system n=1 Tax=Nocardia caishijiensis TaxID=184756 RepID=A0ABQ6YT02_9NOCA|nr:hypothetical protein [Nocardia caishijiensis]KAF0848889.1 hypothetical protein FNL39_101320 [Nocardia caishijiensis]
MTYDPEPTVLLYAADGWSVDARISRHSGKLHFYGQDLGGPFSEYEWSWSFAPETFADIRTALADRDRTRDLLVVVQEFFTDTDIRDPGKWLRDNGIPAEFWSRFEH